jgi:hypothetical protein
MWTMRREALGARMAGALWVAWAVVVWNVIFDRVLVVAGRSYVNAARLAAARGGPYARMDDWMRPAVRQGLWTATAAAAAILLVGFIVLRAAARASASAPASATDPDPTPVPPAR